MQHGNDATTDVMTTDFYGTLDSDTTTDVGMTTDADNNENNVGDGVGDTNGDDTYT